MLSVNEFIELGRAVFGEDFTAHHLYDRAALVTPLGLIPYSALSSPKDAMSALESMVALQGWVAHTAGIHDVKRGVPSMRKCAYCRSEVKPGPCPNCGAG